MKCIFTRTKRYLTMRLSELCLENVLKLIGAYCYHCIHIKLMCNLSGWNLNINSNVGNIDTFFKKLVSFNVSVFLIEYLAIEVLCQV